MRIQRRSILASAALVLLRALPVRAATFPERPITLVVPFAAGTASDLLARTLGRAITTETGQPVLVDNKPGASGIIAAQAVAKAVPDGYTVLIGSNTTHAANPHLFKSLPYDPVKDFTPVTTTGRGAQILVIRPGLAAESVADLLRLAQRSKLSFGSGSASSRVAGELFQQMGKVSLLHVPYKSNTLALTDLLAGQIDMVFTDSATGIPMVQGGKLRALGLTSRSRLQMLPGIPTISEAALDGYEMTYWSGAWVPANTPADVVAKLHALILRAIHADSSSDYYRNTATDRFTLGPDEFARFQQQELLRWKAVIQRANIQPE